VQPNQVLLLPTSNWAQVQVLVPVPVLVPVLVQRNMHVARQNGIKMQQQNWVCNPQQRCRQQQQHTSLPHGLLVLSNFQQLQQLRNVVLSSCPHAPEMGTILLRCSFR
jgi:hypothetical protein